MHTQTEPFLEQLTRRLGDYSSLAGAESENQALGMVLAVTYQNVPQPGLLTGFTYGLSTAQHPAWQPTKPELAITVQSTDEGWVHALAYLAEWHREQHTFAPGSLFHYGQPITAESAMDSFLIFTPLPPEDKTYLNVELDSTTISFLMAYPLYRGEVSLIQKVGIRKFMGLPEYEFFNVSRPDLSTLYQVGE